MLVLGDYFVRSKMKQMETKESNCEIPLSIKQNCGVFTNMTEACGINNFSWISFLVLYVISIDDFAI